MTNSFQELTDEQFTRALEEFLFPRLLKILAAREPGHCMRAADLELPLTIALTQRLRGETLNALVYILVESRNTAEASDLFISSTKLVELRNPPVDGQLRPPLLVFIPPNMRSSVEDSIGVATFEDITTNDIYTDLIRASLG